MLKVNKIKFKFEKSSFDFNFKLIDRKIIGVIGKSGSGKSTLFSLIAGLLMPKSGTIYFDGKNITNLKPADRNMTIMFQDYNNFNHLSVFENIILGVDSNMKKTTNNLVKVNNILKKVSLKIDINKKVSDLSGGEQQRVTIARCLLRKKSLLLLDEPFNALDPGLRKNLYEDIKKISCNNKITTLISSHLIDEMRNVTDNFLFINKGKIIENKILTYRQLLKNKSFKEYLK
tara:strand:+ start:706 stop:1398 length:693 start_codon:yes stop_codon:yes gene_type:complete